MVTINQIKNEKADFERRFAERQRELNKIAEMLNKSPLLKDLDKNGCELLQEYFKQNGFTMYLHPGKNSGEMTGSLRHKRDINAFIHLTSKDRFDIDISGKSVILTSFTFQLSPDLNLIRWWQFRRKWDEFWMFRKLRKMFCDKK